MHTFNGSEINVTKLLRNSTFNLAGNIFRDLRNVFLRSIASHCFRILHWITITMLFPINSRGGHLRSSHLAFAAVTLNNQWRSTGTGWRQFYHTETSCYRGKRQTDRQAGKQAREGA